MLGFSSNFSSDPQPYFLHNNIFNPDRLSDDLTAIDIQYQTSLRITKPNPSAATNLAGPFQPAPSTLTTSLRQLHAFCLRYLYDSGCHTTLYTPSGA
jgi:hypothetical protein